MSIENPTFFRAVRAAVQMAKKGYSLSFCVKRACEQSGYPTKAHVERAMREELGEQFLEARARLARQAHSAKSAPEPQDPFRKKAKMYLAIERKRDRDHFKSI